MTVLTKRTWQQNVDKLREKFPELTDEDLEFVEGREESFIERICERTGASRREIEEIVGEGQPTIEDLMGGKIQDLDHSRGSGIPDDTAHSGGAGM